MRGAIVEAGPISVTVRSETQYHVVDSTMSDVAVPGPVWKVENGILMLTKPSEVRPQEEALPSWQRRAVSRIE